MNSLQGCAQITIIEPAVVEVVKPIHFEAIYRYKDMNVLVNRNDIANIAEALCRVSRDEGEIRGIIALAAALGVEVK